MRGPLRSIGAALGALLAFAVLALVATWPLGAHLGSELPDVQTACRFDTIYTIWALAWQSHALTSAPSTILDANIYWPAPRTLFYGPTGIGALPLFGPVFLATGNPLLALNATFLGGIVLTAWCLHLVVVHWTGRWFAGVVAATSFLATRWVFWYWVPTAPHHAVLCWMPLIVLLASTPARSFGRALLLLPLIVLQCAVDLVYVAPAVLLPLGVLAVVRVIQRDTRAAGLRLTGVLALSALALAPLYAAMLDVRLSNPDLAHQTVWERAPIMQPIVFPASWLNGTYPTAVPAAAFALVAMGAWLRRRRAAAPSPAWRHTTYWTIAGLVLATSPVLAWGPHRLVLPHAALPFYDVVRLPARLGIVAMIGLCLMAGLGFAECLRAVTSPVSHRLRAFALAAVVFGGTYVEYRNGTGNADHPVLPATYQTQGAPAPDVTIGLALRDGAGPLLELPLSRRVFLPVRHARAMYRSIYHWRPILNGYASYWPAGFAERMALADRLPDPDALAELRRLTGLTTLVVHTNEFLDPATRAAWQAVATSGRTDLRLESVVSGVSIFAVTPPA